MRKSLLISFIIILTLSFNSIIAQEQISGPQSGILGPGQYIVIGDIEVQAGETLEIVPGTEFKHQDNFRWDIYGRLNAEGIAGDSIYFIPEFELEEYRWGGIKFNSGSSEESTIDYCVIDRGDFPYPEWAYEAATGIYIEGAGITVSNASISNWLTWGSGGGIYAQNAPVTIENCLIVKNIARMIFESGGGIYLDDCDGASILYNVIAFNEGSDG